MVALKNVHTYYSSHHSSWTWIFSRTPSLPMNGGLRPQMPAGVFNLQSLRRKTHPVNTWIRGSWTMTCVNFHKTQEFSEKKAVVLTGHGLFVLSFLTHFSWGPVMWQVGLSILIKTLNFGKHFRPHYLPWSTWYSWIETGFIIPIWQTGELTVTCPRSQSQLEAQQEPIARSPGSFTAVFCFHHHDLIFSSIDLFIQWLVIEHLLICQALFSDLQIVDIPVDTAGVVGSHTNKNLCLHGFYILVGGNQKQTNKNI